MDPISLCRCRVLYLGSAIPLETAVGIEALQNPCRDRYSNVDDDQKASGIDSTLSVFSSGIMLSYSNDPASNNWFPINSLHVCAAVKAVQESGPFRFVSLDTAAAQRSSNPPLFACIMRRTKGIKVLECHVFVCKSNQAAMALVQSCTHAFSHKEGWLDGEMPTSMAGGTRIVSAGGSGGFGGGSVSRGGGGGKSGFYNNRSDLIQKFDVACRIDPPPKPAPAPAPTPAPAPAQPACQQVMTPMGPMIIPMNPPGAPLCQPTMPVLQPMMQPQQPMMFPQQGGQMMMNQPYFADWNRCGGQPLMIIPESPFYPGDDVMKKSKKKHHHKKTKKNVPEPKGKTKGKGSKKQASDSGGSDEEETFYVRRSALDGDRRPPHQGGGHRGGTFVQEVVQQAPAPCSPPQPAPPPIVYLPLPQQPAPAPPPPERPNEVLVYAPRIMEANKRMINYQVDDRDTRLDDFHPDNRRFDNRRDLRFLDGRSDSRAYYNRQDDRAFNYSADQRQLNNRQDTRTFDYRADQRRLDNRVDGRALNYSQVQNPDNGALYYRQGLDDAQYRDDQMAYLAQEDDLARQDAEYMRGFYDAQGQLTAAVNDGQQQQQYEDEQYDDDDGGYYPEEVVGYYPEDGYYPQPGYTDDDCYAPEQGYVEEYVVEGDYQRQLPPVVGYQAAVAPMQQRGPLLRDRFVQVADGLGYYP